MARTSARRLKKALTDIDTHAGRLACTLAQYEEAYNEEHRAVYACAGGGFAGLKAQHELKASWCPQRLHNLVEQRLRATTIVATETAKQESAGLASEAPKEDR